jgi:hypothetical protein
VQKVQFRHQIIFQTFLYVIGKVKLITEIINSGGLAGILIVTCRQRGGQTEF